MQVIRINLRKIVGVGISIGAIIILIIYFTFFMTYNVYAVFSTYERIMDAENSENLSELRKMSEVDAFVQKHQNTNRVLYLVYDPISTTIIESGGYTGENLRVFHLSLGMYLECWSDSGQKKRFYSEIIQHLENDSCKGM